MSSPGQIILAGIVILESPRAVDPQKGNRNIAFDVNIPVKDGNDSQTLGLLRYFTPEDRVEELQTVWDNDFSRAFVVCKFAAMPSSGIPSELVKEESLFEYAFIGDITDIIFTDDVNAKHKPCIIASGIVDSSDSSNLTFSLNPSHYINLSHTLLNCNLTCSFDADSKKWKNKKPMPTTGSLLSITGILTYIKRGFDNKTTFQVELDSITYLTRSSANPTFISQDAPSSSSSRRPRFNYDAVPVTTVTPSSPSVSLGKRKQIEDEPFGPSDSSSSHDSKRSRTIDDKRDED